MAYLILICNMYCVLTNQITFSKLFFQCLYSPPSSCELPQSPGEKGHRRKIWTKFRWTVAAELFKGNLDWEDGVENRFEAAIWETSKAIPATNENHLKTLDTGQKACQGPSEKPARQSLKLFKSTDTGQKACQGLARRSQETFEAPSFQAKRETTKIFTWQRQMPTVLCNRRTLTWKVDTFSIFALPSKELNFAKEFVLVAF